MNYDRIILELLDRVSALEDEIKQLKNESITLNDNESKQEVVTPGYSNGRDTTKYILDGKKYARID